MLSRTWLLLGLLAGMACAGPASEGPEADPAINTIRFNVSPGGYPPYTIVHDDGQVSGILWDVLQRIADANGLTVEVRQIPTKRVDDFLRADQLDGTMRAIEWTAHPEDFVFTDGILKAHDVIFRARHNAFRAASLDDLSGATLLANLGFHHPVLADRFSSGDIIRVDVPDTLTMLRRLKQADHFDGGIANGRAALWLIRQHGWSGQFRIEPVSLDVTDYRLMFTPKWAPMMDRFNATIAAMRQSGELETIVSRYLPEDFTYQLSGT